MTMRMILFGDEDILKNSGEEQSSMSADGHDNHGNASSSSRLFLIFLILSVLSAAFILSPGLGARSRSTKNYRPGASAPQPPRWTGLGLVKPR